MSSRWVVLLAGMLLLSGSALAAEITFEEAEVNLGQATATITAITGDEWLPFGIDINGGSVLIYGPPNPDPFAPATDNNGVFEALNGSMEIVFNELVTNLEVDWFAPALDEVTITAFNTSGVAIQIETDNGVGDPDPSNMDTELFGGAIKRLVIEADPGTLCIANLRFDVIQIPTMSTWGLIGSFVLLLAALAGVLVRRARLPITSS